MQQEDNDCLNASFRKVAAVLADQQIALWEYDIPTGTFHFSNNYSSILGLDRAGIVFHSLDELLPFIHPDDRASLSPELLGKKLETENDSSKIRFRCIGTHGEVIWLEDHFFSISKNENGMPERLLSYTVNITSQCEKEEQIRQLEERNRKIIEALPEFIFIFNDNFFITDVLMSHDTVLLHPVEELKGGDGRSFYSPEVSDLFIRNIRKCLQDGELKEIEYPLDAPNGKRYYFQARIAPFGDNEVLALIHDIGDRVLRSDELIEAKRRAEESDRMKTLFLANMSHEIRTPLNAIVGFSEIVADTDNPQEKEEYIGIIQQNSNLLLQLINDILDLSRLESGKSEIHTEPVNLVALIEEVRKVHQLKMTAGVALECIYPEKPVWQWADRNRLTQVLFNFLSNAIKNTRKGTITLGLRTAKDGIELFVQDTGCGIPKEKLSRIFDSFEKLNDFAQGTGLGLTICQSIAGQLGGRIDVRSEEGKGSLFTLRLPDHPAENPKKKKSSEQAWVEVSETKRKRILVIEAVESHYQQIHAALNNTHTLLWVRSGKEAIGRFLHGRPDLVLIDIRMPVSDSIETIERIRTLSPEIPIVALTAMAFYIEQQQALAAGCNAVVSKPYTTEQLKEIVGQLL